LPDDAEDVPLPRLPRRTIRALHFLEEAFGFAISARWDDLDGTVQHAEAIFDDGGVMMGTAERPTASLEGTSVGKGIYVYVEDVDAHFERARAAAVRFVYPAEPVRVRSQTASG
jgi:uncharacterized glyoxalase superfamily protein PhnB